MLDIAQTLGDDITLTRAQVITRGTCLEEFAARRAGVQVPEHQRLNTGRCTLPSILVPTATTSTAKRIRAITGCVGCKFAVIMMTMIAVMHTGNAH